MHWAQYPKFFIKGVIRTMAANKGSVQAALSQVAGIVLAALNRVHTGAPTSRAAITTGSSWVHRQDRGTPTKEQIPRPAYAFWDIFNLKGHFSRHEFG